MLYTILLWFLFAGAIQKCHTGATEAEVAKLIGSYLRAAPEKRNGVEKKRYCNEQERIDIAVLYQYAIAVHAVQLSSTVIVITIAVNLCCQWCATAGQRPFPQWPIKCILVE